MNDLNAQMGRILKFTSTLQGSYSRINRAGNAYDKYRLNMMKKSTNPPSVHEISNNDC